jgi:hypothetical protein
LVSSTNKTDRHDIAEIVLKVALNTIKPTNQAYIMSVEPTRLSVESIERLRPNRGWQHFF